jgi:hypothetical protein
MIRQIDKVALKRLFVHVDGSSFEKNIPTYPL